MIKVHDHADDELEWVEVPRDLLERWKQKCDDEYRIRIALPEGSVRLVYGLKVAEDWTSAQLALYLESQESGEWQRRYSLEGGRVLTALRALRDIDKSYDSVWSRALEAEDGWAEQQLED